MYLGRRPLGQEVPFTVATVDGSGASSWPIGPPTIEIWKGAALLLAGKPMPKIDAAYVGLFRKVYFLDRRFSTGLYRSIIRWTIGSYLGVQIDDWEITAGGNPDGAVIGMAYHEMPFASFIVQHLDSGNLVRGKNPKV
jgi:hypothetical protein